LAQQRRTFAATKTLIMGQKRTKEDFENAAKQSFSIAGMCRCLNIRPSGGNYKLMHNAIIKYDMKLDLTTYEILHILSISLTSKTHLRDLLDKTNFQNDKERFDSSEPLLFNLNF
jgi:hypothetical protein